MMSFAQWGNALYSGDKSYAVVPKRKVFVSLAAAVIVVGLMLAAAIGFNRSIEFTGGAQFDVTNVSDQSEAKASDIVTGTGLVPNAKVTRVGTNGVRIQTESLDSDQTAQVRDALVSAYGVDASDVQSSTIGPSWGKSVTTKALQSLVIFMALIAVLMTVYFRSWTMAAAALLALVHDIAVTFAVFVITQVEVSPATVIGFLTILGYSLYDTVVVFDKVRELTRDVYDQKRFTFAEFVNLAVNQTMVRSINTSVVALLPVGAILIIGSLLLGTGTLTDISLALFVGMIAGTYSSIFIASPLLVMLQERMKKTREHDGIVAKDRQARAADSSQGTPAPVKVAPVVAGRRLSNAHQPKRKKTQR
ncbi:protein translocase subunit SecF [Schaalia cardiffensis]|uniref:Protein-export membrane protein SecF n=1 Tax=Schaalia cardiffensis F0333 TaxID=888050 RepID=N6X2B0_9ACTO|nr:protein translocase subunit SecF [Schaalia cardiffensis]ENO17582.1 protein-export membrane protein SecF [Schaalia cardiffensis F0333]MBJ2328234.1 protein translocase subunit SecF [Schaalia cardiffensis]